MLSAQALQPKTLGEPHAVHGSPRIAAQTPLCTGQLGRLVQGIPEGQLLFRGQANDFLPRRQDLAPTWATVTART